MLERPESHLRQVGPGEGRGDFLIQILGKSDQPNQREHAVPGFRFGIGAGVEGIILGKRRNREDECRQQPEYKFNAATIDRSNSHGDENGR
jgi:hypothetical protein